jgi:C-terminal processing protease CtpA/Prc
MLKARTFGILLAAVLVALATSPARAQQQSDPNKKPQQPSAAPQGQNQGQAEKPAEKPREDAKKADNAKKAEKPMADKDKAQPEKDRPNANRSRESSRDPSRSDRSSQPSTDRSRDTSRDSQRSTDRSRDTSRDSQPSTDRSRDTSRDSQRSTDRSRDTSRDSQRSTDRSRDTSRDSQRSSDRSSQKQFSASDLGFKFSENDTSKGLKITNINNNTVATKSEFKQGDVIVSVSDHTIRSERDFIRFLQVGGRQRIPVVVLRDDREVTLYIAPDLIQEFVTTSGGAWLGVDLWERFSRAAVIQRVHPGSPAERAGLRADDLIVAINGEDIRSPEHLGEVIGSMAPGTDVEIEVERNRQSRVLDATLGQRETVTQRTEIRERSVLPRR